MKKTGSAIDVNIRTEEVCGFFFFVSDTKNQNANTGKKTQPTAPILSNKTAKRCGVKGLSRKILLKFHTAKQKKSAAANLFDSPYGFLTSIIIMIITSVVSAVKCIIGPSGNQFMNAPYYPVVYC